MKKLYWLICVLFVSACGGTNIEVENKIAGATMVDVRWVPESSKRPYRVSGDGLLPGESSAGIRILNLDEDETGPLHFELSVSGNRVSLVTEDHFTATAGETTHITISDDTHVTNPLLDPS